MEDLEFQLWMQRQSKKLDKKYYSRGMPVYILHKRALASAFSVVDNLRRIDFQELALTSYFMIKEAGLNELAHCYEMMLALAKTDPDKFVSRIYDFYVKTADIIKKKGLHKQFFEFLSMFVNSDHSDFDDNTCKVYDAYTDLIINQHEFLRSNKFEMNKLVAGVDSKGNVIEIDDAYPFLDYPMTEIEHESFRGTIDDPNEMLKKHYAKYGYTVKDGMETMLLGNICRAYTNTILSMAPYTNEFTIDVLPTKGFDPRITDYLSNIPIPHSDPSLREMLNHRRRTLPPNGVKIHFDGSLLYRDMLFKEVYHDDAIICLFRIELSKGEIAGFYNTRTGKFSSPFHMNATNVFHFGLSVERLFLWAYAAFTTNEMLPTTESYRNVMIDPYAEVTFTSIPGKLRVPTNCKHIRTIAGKDGYESTVKHINGYIRKLPEGQKASEKAVAIAESLGYSLAPDETYVCPFERTSWITKINK